MTAWSVGELAVDRGHAHAVVAVTRRLRYLGVDAGEICLRQLHVGRGEVLLEVLAAFRAGYGDDVAALRQYPRERELAGGARFLACELLDLRHETKVVVEVL